MVSHLQNKYRWLYFIPGRLVSKLFKLLTSKPPLIDEVVTEVTYLFSHEFDMMKLRDSCSVSLLSSLPLYFIHVYYCIVVSALLS